ncbi:MAG: alpha/beta hydrolase family esterase [Gammaproteobacteria bacterium]
MFANRLAKEQNPRCVDVSGSSVYLQSLGAGLVVTVTLLFSGCAPDPELREASYEDGANQVRCEPGARTGGVGITNDESTREGIKFNVRTPLNYDPTIAHPLLMVYAPAKRSRMSTERFTDFTPEATAAGFVVAYADHRPLSPSSLVELAAAPRLVAQKWCIDEDHIFLTGNSDGGTVAMGLAFIAGTKELPAAIAPSAVGINRRDLSARQCPDPIPVMVMHSANDRLFPGYGAEAVEWWAKCNKCELEATEKLDNGCVAYSGCANGVQTWYCEGSDPHSKWPRLNNTIIDFFVTSETAEAVANARNDQNGGIARGKPIP